jgi:rSAM/selenodomain-associated transferase 1
MVNDDIALGIMCKAPVEGACKTRLCPPLTPAEAAEVSRRFIADVAQVIAGVAPGAGVRGVAVYTPAEDAAAFDGMLPGGFAMLGQRGRDLGERLLHATEDLLQDGCSGVCLINSDSPTLPETLLQRTVDALRQPGDRIVLGPAIDGGYYLIGLKRAHAALFQGVAWSTSQVLAQTLARAAGLRLPVTLLPLWYDVDDLGSLQVLLHELFGNGVPVAVDGLRGSPAERSRRYLTALLQAPGVSRFGFPGGTAVR